MVRRGEYPMTRRLQAVALWYMRRLSAMSVPEFGYRIIEAGRKILGRLQDGWVARENAVLHTVARVERCFLTGTLTSEMMAALEREAALARQGSIALLGCAWPSPASWPPPATFWHIAPDEKESAAKSQAYCFDASYASVYESRDIKRIGEINRLQFLIPLAVHARRTGNVADRDLVFHIIFAWMDANVPFRGLAFASGIELALRVISVALALSVLGDLHLSESRKARLAAFFDVHARWIDRFPSLYSSANNHRIAELTGLSVCAEVLGYPIGAEHRATLFAELLSQFNADGVGAEQSPTYTAFTVELALVAFLFAGIGPPDLPNVLRKRLRAWAEQTLWLMDEVGRVPDIGDNDATRVIMFGQAQEPRYVASILAALASWLDEPTLSPPARDPHLRDLMFASKCGHGIVSAGFKQWRAGGYSVFRKERAAAILIFDHGPVGHLSIAAHGHADTLAVWFTVGRTPVFIDAGTTTYRRQDPLRDALRKTGVHNTLAVAGASSSVPSDSFNWSLKAEAVLTQTTADPPCVTARHNGYLKRFGVRHERAVRLAEPDRFEIVDRLIGASAGVPVQIAFLLGPNCCVKADASNTWRIATDGEDIVRLKASGPLAGRLETASMPPFGMFAPAYGCLEPTSRLVFSGGWQRGSEQKLIIEILR